MLEYTGLALWLSCLYNCDAGVERLDDVGFPSMTFCLHDHDTGLGDLMTVIWHYGYLAGITVTLD